MVRIAIRLRQGLLLVALGTLIGCAATFSNHGYAPSPKDLSAIKVGTDTRASVEAAIGRPSSTGMLKSGGWYYLSSRVKHYAYRKDQMIDRQLVAVTFRKDGRVKNIERFSLADGRVIALNRRVTESGIKGRTFLRQLLSSIGRPDIAKSLQP